MPTVRRRREAEAEYRGTRAEVWQGVGIRQLPRAKAEVMEVDDLWFMRDRAGACTKWIVLPIFGQPWQTVPGRHKRSLEKRPFAHQPAHATMPGTGATAQVGAQQAP